MILWTDNSLLDEHVLFRLSTITQFHILEVINYERKNNYYYIYNYNCLTYICFTYFTCTHAHTHHIPAEWPLTRAASAGIALEELRVLMRLSLPHLCH